MFEHELDFVLELVGLAASFLIHFDFLNVVAVLPFERPDEGFQGF